VELASFVPSGAKNLDVDPRFLENLWTPGGRKENSAMSVMLLLHFTCIKVYRIKNFKCDLNIPTFNEEGLWNVDCQSRTMVKKLCTW
jgi:hypothetical protein